jgi:hypothetical protein
MSSKEGGTHGQQLLLTMGPLQLSLQLMGRKHSGMPHPPPVSGFGPSLPVPVSSVTDASPPPLDEAPLHPPAARASPSAATHASPDWFSCDIRSRVYYPRGREK